MSTWDGYPAGYASHVRDLEATDADARVSEDEGRYRIPVPPGGKTGFRYRVLLEHDPASHPSGPDESPRTFDASAVWTGRALFLTAE